MTMNDIAIIPTVCSPLTAANIRSKGGRNGNILSTRGSSKGDSPRASSLPRPSKSS